MAEIGNKEKLRQFYEEYKFQIIMMTCAITSYSLIKRQIRLNKKYVNSSNPYQREQNIYTNLMRKIYGPAASFQKEA
jgi:hypothetical protein